MNCDKSALWQQESGDPVWVTEGLIAKGDNCKAKPAGSIEQGEEPQFSEATQSP